MVRAVETLVDLWTFGVPVVLIVGALLRLLGNVPARVRYAIAIAGFVAVLVVPFWEAAHVRAFGDAPHPASGHALSAGRGEGLLIVWAAGAVLLLVRDVSGHLRLLRARLAFEDAPVALKHALRWPVEVPLLISANAAPFTVGLLRPAVVLPRVLDVPEDVVRRIALHELSHARWRDPLVFALLRAIAAFFWVSPVWLVLRWVRREREIAADAFALRGGAAGAEETYVAALVRLARSRSARPLAAAMAASDLEYRARRILAPQRASFVALLVLAAGLMLFSFAVPAHLQAEDARDDNDREVIRIVVRHRS